MKTGDVARHLGVSPETVRIWLKEFSAYFAEQKTKQRHYSDEDLIVLGTIAKYSHEGYGFKAIHEKLESGERVESLTETTYGVDTRMIPAAAAEQMLDATELRLELETIKRDYDRLLQERDADKARIVELEHEIKDLNQRLFEVQQKWIDDLRNKGD